MLHTVIMRLWFKPSLQLKLHFVLPIFQQSNLIYKFQYCCNATYIESTSQRLEVRATKHVPRDICIGTTSRHSKLLDSAICEYLNALNSCAVNYNYECVGACLA